MTKIEDGCSACFPPDAAQAWQARDSLVDLGMLLDDSHYIVRAMQCTACGQRFVSVTTEQVDWDNGDDPVHRVQLPISEVDHQMLTTRHPAALEAALHALDPTRRALHFDWPKDGAQGVYWGKGLRVLPHD